MKILEDLEQIIQSQPAASTVSLLSDIWDRDPKLVYEASTEQIDLASVRVSDVVSLARLISRGLSEGYTIVSDGEAFKLVVWDQESGPVHKDDLSTMLNLVRSMSGVYVGLADPWQAMGATQQEIDFKLGDQSKWAVFRELVNSRRSRRPLLIQLDARDLDSLAKRPPYISYELLNCAKKVVQAPNAVFKGLRTSGHLQSGLAFCGRPKNAFTNEGVPEPAPEGMVFMAFVTPDRCLFDWGWFEPDPEDATLPKEWRSRFGERVEFDQEATIIGLDQVKINADNQARVATSTRGDCVFLYTSNAPSYAIRINDEVTQFASRADHSRTGYKFKGIDKIIEQAEREDTPLHQLLVALGREAEEKEQASAVSDR